MSAQPNPREEDLVDVEDREIEEWIQFVDVWRQRLATLRDNQEE